MSKLCFYCNGVGRLSIRDKTRLEDYVKYNNWDSAVTVIRGVDKTVEGYIVPCPICKGRREI